MGSSPRERPGDATPVLEKNRSVPARIAALGQGALMLALAALADHESKRPIVSARVCPAPLQERAAEEAVESAIEEPAAAIEIPEPEPLSDLQPNQEVALEDTVRSVWDWPDGEIPLGETVLVMIGDAESQRSIAVRFPSQERVLYFDERPFELIVKSKLTKNLEIPVKVSMVQKKQQSLTIGSAGGSATMDEDRMKQLCEDLILGSGTSEFPVKTVLGKRTGVIRPVEKTDGEGR